MTQTIKALFTDPVLRAKILFVLGMLVVFRFLSTVPAPGLPVDVIETSLANNQLLGILSILSGGGLMSFSIVMLGVGPYITASIIFQLMTVLVPRFKEMQKEEGEMGRKKLTQYARYATLPLALIQGYGLLALITSQVGIPMITGTDLAIALTTITAGTYLLTWIGEMISERGIGNGVSLIIFAGIVATLPTIVSQQIALYSVEQIPFYIAMIALTIITVFVVVYFTEAERPIGVQYARQGRNGSQGVTNTYLPVRVTQAGVMPIIFALSLFSLPQMFGQVFATSANTILATVADWINAFFANQLLYGVTYFVLVFAFTYFYTAFVVEPDDIANNLQKGGGFIPGIRPGKSTTEYIGNVISRVTFVGATFFAIVAVLPIVVQWATGATQNIVIGGTALLIVVSVVIDIIKKVNAQLSMREYL